MTTLLALDLSVRSAGWAMFTVGDARPTFGTWELAPHIDWRARAFVRLHKNLLDLHRVTPVDVIVYEEPLAAHSVQGRQTSTIEAMVGLASHAMSFAEAVGASHRAVNMATWRRSFIGKMPRGTKSVDLKAMAMTRCRELGFDPAKHDAAEAIGLLDYELSIRGITPPWREANLLTRQLHPATDGRAAA